MPAIPDLVAPLRDGHVWLRFASERDIPEILIAHQDDSEMHARLGERRPPSAAALGREAEQAPAARAAGAAVTLTIVQAESDECKGQVRAQHLDWAGRRAELAIWVAPHARRRGFARRGLRLAAAWLFGACGLERLELRGTLGNEPLQAAALAAGFVLERDGAVMSLAPANLER